MKKKGIWILVGGFICLVAVAVICAWFAAKKVTESTAGTDSAELVSVTSVPEETAQPEEDEDSAEAEATEEAEEEPEAEPYDSPIDFEALQAVNSDIYAWLQIDNTNIDYPIVQHPTDNTYYLTHDSDGNVSANGAVFTELYNNTDFSDPVTLLYGHHMKSGTIFGNLQSYYSDSTFFAENEIIKIYTPTALLEYEVFAAVPYSSDHLLYYHDFTDDSVFKAFFEGVMNIRTIGSNLNEYYAPEPGDKVIILSTCLAGNNTQRFLVMAKLIT